jgi:hypothetical protein
VESPARATPDFPEYTNQNSDTTFFHSGIATSTGVVWDTNFANIVRTALPNNGSFNEIGFAFMECYGGGMIDELLNRNLAFASYISAARWDQVAWADDPRRAAGVVNQNNYESTYNLPYAPVAGGPVIAPGGGVNTLSRAAMVGYNTDIYGPVRNQGPVLFPGGVGGRPVVENPQYTSSGPIGDSITLHNNNPMNSTANTKYLAIEFGGSTVEPGNTNSVARITNSLAGRGFGLTEVQVIPPGGTAQQLAAAWANVGRQANATTQIYYWNSWGHGSLSFDFVGFIKNLLGGASPAKGVAYSFGLTSDFVSDVRQHANYVRSLGGAGPLDAPYVEIQTSSATDGIGLILNGDRLSPIGSAFDLLGDGSFYDYRFALTDADLAALSVNDMVSLDWTAFAVPSFGLGDINVGDLTNYLLPVPEPSALAMSGTAILILLSYRWRRRRAERDSSPRVVGLIVIRKSLRRCWE